MLGRADEFENLASEVALERRSAAMARERVTIYRRDIGKMIEAGAASGAGEVWRTFRERFSVLCYRLPRKVSTITVGPLVDELHALVSRNR